MYAIIHGLTTFTTFMEFLSPPSFLPPSLPLSLDPPLPPDSQLREFLSGQPFIDYVDSPYYWRYLQWKYLEK